MRRSDNVIMMGHWYFAFGTTLVILRFRGKVPPPHRWHCGHYPERQRSRVLEGGGRALHSFLTGPRSLKIRSWSCLHV